MGCFDHILETVDPGKFDNAYLHVMDLQLITLQLISFTRRTKHSGGTPLRTKYSIHHSRSSAMIPLRGVQEPRHQCLRGPETRICPDWPRRISILDGEVRLAIENAPSQTLNVIRNWICTCQSGTAADQDRPNQQHPQHSPQLMSSRDLFLVGKVQKEQVTRDLRHI